LTDQPFAVTLVGDDATTIVRRAGEYHEATLESEADAIVTQSSLSLIPA